MEDVPYIGDVTQSIALSRRTVMLATASASALLLVPELLLAAPTDLPDHIIDAHCHVFNAHDLPAAGYAVYVVAREHGVHGNLLSHAMGVVVGVLKKYASKDPEAKLADEKAGEADIQTALTAADTAFSVHVGDALREIAANAAPTNVFVKSPLQLSVERDLKANGFEAPSSLYQVQIGNMKIGANYEAGVLDTLSRHYEVEREAPPLDLQQKLNERFGDNIHGELPLELPHAAFQFSLSPLYRIDKLVAKIVKDAEDVVTSLGGVFGLLKALVRRRQTNISKLDEAFTAFDRPKPAARFYAPSAVDFDCWLGPDADTSYPLARQARIMKMLARRQAPNVLVHGYMAYDPLRAILHEHGVDRGEEPFAVATRAVLEQGYIGVKIYPPMGFRATKNTELSNKDFGEKVGKWLPRLPGNINLGTEIDRHLERIYRFCLKHEVPILTHTSNSQSTFTHSAENAWPQYWLDVLDRTDGGADGNFRNLRVNLGHFGAFTCHVNPTAIPDKDEDSENARCGVAWNWADTIIDAVAPAAGNSKYPNLYFDISDERELVDDAKRTTLANYLLQRPNNVAARVTERMLYGTDWMFLVTAGHPHHRFRKAVSDFVRRLGGKNVDVFTDNAAHFLGLEEKACDPQDANCRNNLLRLRDFHRDDQARLTTLKRFVVQPRTIPA